MPLLSSKRLVLRDSYYSAPPLTTSSHILLSPRLSCAEEAGRPRASLQPIKVEVRESDSVKFIVDKEDIERPVKLEWPVKIEPDPCQLTARVAILRRGPGPERTQLPHAAALPRPFRPTRPGGPASRTWTAKRQQE